MLLKRAQTAPKTVLWYEESLKAFYTYTARVLGKPPASVEPGEITQILVLQWLEQLRERLAGASVNTRYRALRALVNWFIDEDYLEKSPMPRRAPRIPKTLPPIFTKNEVAAMLRLCPPKVWWGARDQALIIVPLTTGLRREELVMLDINDIRFEDRLLLVRHGKGDKQRYVDLPAQAMSAMLRYQKHRDPAQSAFFQTVHGGRVSGNAILQVFGKLGRRAGIETTRCSPHTARHTFATEYLRSGGDLRRLQRLMGHSSIKVTEVYLQNITPEDAVSQQRELRVFENWGL